MPSIRTEGCIGAPEIKDARAPFSNFDFVEERFKSTHPKSLMPIKRILSRARMAEFQTITIEEIKSVGFSKEDDEELQVVGAKASGTLIRLGFFKKYITTPAEISSLTDSDFFGYAILKKIEIKDIANWIVFESVLGRVRHDNNYHHSLRDYRINIGGKEFNIKGNIYCQQNGLTNVCAHATLRACISSIVSDSDVSYKKMNTILKDKGIPHQLGEGLRVDQIKAVLEKLEINYKHYWYSEENKDRPNIPYHKFLYSSIESGFPALLGFTFGENDGHIISVLGHTFNEDTWVPNADVSYFQIGEDIRFVPSESWVSTYVCQDDNFGSDYCLPRLFNFKGDVHVFALQPKNSTYDAIDAEAVAADYLHDLVLSLNPNPDNKWLKRLREAVLIKDGWFVLRPLYLSGAQYYTHLENLKGWAEETIRKEVLEVLKEFLKGHYWVIEVSLPELFPANRRKLGEIVLNAEEPVATHKDLSSFVFARLVNEFTLLMRTDPSNLQVVKYESGISTHTNIFSHDTPV